MRNNGFGSAAPNSTEIPAEAVQEFFSSLSRRAAQLKTVVAFDPFGQESIASAILWALREAKSILEAVDAYAYALGEVQPHDRKNWTAIDQTVLELFGTKGFEQIKQQAQEIAKENGNG